MNILSRMIAKPMPSFVVDHVTNTVLAYVFGKRQDEVFEKLHLLFILFNISGFYTDGRVINIT